MPAETVGQEISALTRKGPTRGARKGKPYSRRQAIAASLSMARRGEFGKKAQRKARRGGR